MAKPLVIVESRAKAETIAGFLGRDRYVVKASIGHIRDLPRSAGQVPKSVTKREVRRLGIDVDDHFAPVYVVPDDKKHVVRELKAALKDASELYLATDEDREGEAISWHLLEVLKPTVPVKRMVFHEITSDAIAEAIDNWRDLDMKLVEAQEGRRVLDRLVGYEVSNVTFRRIGRGTSAGRVQSVATRLIVDRERARMAFRAASYWDLEGTFSAAASEFPASLVSLDGRRLASGRDFDAGTGALAPGSDVAMLDEQAAVALAARLTDRPFSVASIEARTVTERPKAPFITSTLQQEAARKLGFSAARTMHVAQGLYERGLVTYMRTDSTSLATQAVDAARAQIRRMYGNEYLPERPRTYQSKVKNAQEAHEAIRPAGDRMYTVDDLEHELRGADERRLYDLIWKRTVASQMSDARIRRVALRLTATSTAGEAAVFQASGRTIEFPGYLRAYVEGADDPDAELEDRETILPPLSEGEAVVCRELRPTGHTTQPPARYTEASLVKELEERGIGRPSTYASVIDTIVNKRDYAWKKGTALVPSWTAFAKVQLLERYFTDLIDYEFTATMEEALDAIARGEGEAEKWLHSFYFGNGNVGLRELVAEEHLATIDMAEVNAVHVGFDAEGRDLVVRVWPNGANIERGDEKAPIPADLAPDELTPERAEDLLAQGAVGPRVLGADPQSALPVLALTGRFGPFVQLGEVDNGSKDKPKRASLFASMDPSTITLDQALALLSLPRVVGADTEGNEITAQNGRYGPYLKKGSDTRSLGSEDELFTVTVDEALALFAQPKQRRGRVAKPPLAELGSHPDSGAPVRVLDGRYGPYVTDGTTNASVPRGTDPESLTLDQGVDLLRERAARAPATKRTVKKTARKTAKTAAKKRTTKKAARTPAKKAGGKATP
ncbi:MAG TPA: type I DNA topoisomerase [Acidimicrobiia bacterium]|nr:type I DNA topoisomerase [Acidimicrobiia bacterium]